MNITTKKKALLAIQELWTTFGKKPIHYTSQRQVYMKYRVTRILSHYLVNCGYATKPKRGYIQLIINDMPNLAMVESISKYASEYQKELNEDAKVKSEQLKLIDQGEVIKKHIVNEATMSEQVAIRVLKSLGYKIMKPISQYEEV